MQQINTNELKAHPQNNYYFDDMEGDAWDSLLQSISTSGVTNAITINDKKQLLVDKDIGGQACNYILLPVFS